MVTIGKLENTLVGTIHVAANADGLVAISLWDDESRFLAEVMRLVGKAPDVAAEPSVFVKTALAELDAYFRGDLREFTVPIDWSVMQPFQQDALHLVCAVPYGHTTNYGTIADQLGRPGAARAVGRANATNPMPIIIPCHRILGADGKLHGYGARGGIETKAKLLRLEGSWLI
ncbi:MAG: methylated-DNA--[protein]-cysteine S-methyltransferase [Candidatus Promineofilum sp.]|nr:methylated-DNA--[protein]-cysteine S-methyltransferase [Promineifilum sp.]MBP9657499.1 methylated-DNA--[protein]-cysteine S-methyltransferase [Promineifilum sp.]